MFPNRMGVSGSRLNVSRRTEQCLRVLCVGTGKTNNNMKTKILSVACALIASIALAEVTVKTTTTTGTITEYVPGTTFVVKETSGPMKYRYGKKVTYVTKKGKTLTDEDVKLRVKVGSPVTVHYTTEGEDRVIERIEVDDD